MDGESDSTVSLLPAGATMGHYTVERLLGVGGSAQVYLALDGRLGRHVALKVLTAGAFSAELQRRFTEEAKAAASLNHPNVAVVYEVGACDGNCFIAMEYVEGETFRRRLQDPNAGLPELLGCLRQAAKAIAAAHGRGIVHCDLKPDNIMVTREGEAKILDFGLARLLARYKSDGEARPGGEGRQQILFSMRGRTAEGTPGYMSPEQAEGNSNLDERTDIFSFGCILYEAVARKLPFGAAGDSLYRLRQERPRRLAELCPSVPAGLARIVESCLEKDPELRCSSMAEVESALGRAVEAMRQRSRSALARRMWMIGAAAVVAAVAAGLGWHSLRRSPAPAPSIAVIPFVPSQPGADIEYICEGLSEGIINALAQVSGLKVVARSSSFRFRDSTMPAQKMAQLLGVNSLVTGSVTGRAGRLRITVDLVAADGSQLWGMQYSPAASELAGVEERISNEIAQRIVSQLTELDKSKLARTGKVIPEAYALYLRARYHLRLYTPASRERAVSYYEQTLAIDPHFALAHAELANLYRNLGGSAVQSAASALPRAEAAALRALAADKDLAEAHAALADVRKDQWNWEAAESGYRKALELNANLVEARQGYAILLGVRNRHPEAISQIRRALDLDPLGLPTMVHAAAVYSNARRFGDALEILNRALGMDPGSPSAWFWRGSVNSGSGHYDQAIKAYEKAFEFGDDSAATKCYYSFALARSGRLRDARDVVEAVEQSANFVPPSAMAIAYLGMNRRAEAIRALQRAYEVRDPLLQYLQVEAHFDELAQLPAFIQLARSIGLRR